jgi:hypothetical protein
MKLQYLPSDSMHVLVCRVEVFDGRVSCLHLHLT